MEPLDTWLSQDHHYVNHVREPLVGVIGQSFSGRVQSTCESAEGLSASSWRDFEAYPAVCVDLARCERWRSCVRLARRAQVVRNARLAVAAPSMRAGGSG